MATACVDNENNHRENENARNGDQATLDENHPLVRRFQETLRKHLETHRERLLYEHRDIVKGLKSKKKEREDLGTQLYAVQKRVDEYKSNLETLSSQSSNLEAGRPSLEKHLEKSKQSLAKLEETVQHECKEDELLSRKVQELNRQLHGLVLAEEAAKSDAVVLKQATKKAASEFAIRETDKQKQDEHVNRLLDNLQASKMKSKMYEEQTLSLSQEAQAIRQTIQQARIEIETINLEEKLLLDQWNESLGRMLARDEALTLLQESYIAKAEALRISQSEILSVEKFVKNEEDLTRKHSSLLQRLASDIDSLSKQLSKKLSNRESLRLDVKTNLKCSINELQVVIDTQKNVKLWKEQEIKDVNKALQALIIEKHKLQESLTKQVINYNWADKSTQATLKDVEKIREQIKRLEQEKAKAEDSILKLQLNKEEILGSTEVMLTDLEQLKQSVKKKEKDYKEKEAGLTKYVFMIEKKQQHINHLRHKLDQKQDVKNGKIVNAAESPMDSLQRELKEKLVEAQALQNTWLNQQRNLVQLSQEKEKLVANIRHMQRQYTVYSQRKLYLESEVGRVINDYKVLERNISRLHNVISKMNELAYNEHTQEDALNRVTILTEDDLLSNLKDSEAKLVTMKDRLEHLKVEEDAMSKKLLDAENELLLWQQKFHLTKQVRSTVCSEYKKGEIYSLQSNLRKMQVEYSGICRAQGKLAYSMDQAVNRFGALLSKGETAMMANKVSVQTTLGRQIEDARKRIKYTVKETGIVHDNVGSLVQQYDELNQDVLAKQLANKNFKTVLQNLNDEISESILEKAKSFEEVVVRQHHAKLYQEVKDSKYKLLCRTPDVLESELEKHKQRACKLKDILQQLAEDFPDIAVDLNVIQMKQEARIVALGI